MPIHIVATYLISFLLTAALGAVVFFKNPSHKINKSFSFLILSILGWQATLFGFYYLNQPELVLLLGRANFVFAELLSLSLFIFCFFFPQKTKLGEKKHLYIIASIIIVLAVATLFTPFLIKDEVIVAPAARETIFGFLYPFFVLYFIIFCFGAIAVLLQKFKYLTGIFRQQVLYLAVGFFLAIATGSITNIFLPLLFGIYDYQHLSLFSLLIFVSFVSYAIVKHRLMDIRFLVARTISYSLLVFILGSLYALGLFLVGNSLFPGSATSKSLLISTLLALILAYTFQPMRRMLEKTTDKIFFRDRYDTQKLLKKLNTLLVSTYLVKDLLDNVLSLIQEKLKVSRIDIILLKDHQIGFHLSKGTEDSSVEFSYQEIMRLKRYANLKEIFYDDLESSDIKEYLAKRNIRIIFPLRNRGNFIGFLMLSDKLSGDIYSKQDVTLLELFIPELSLAIQNAEAVAEISKFNITLKKKIAEATRELKEANLQLKELDNLKDQFLSVASHELRTPMTAIKSYLWMALDGQGGELTEKQQYYIERSYDSADRLIKLVNDLLNISRIESGRISFEIAKLNIVELCQAVIEEIRPRADELGLELIIKKPVKDKKKESYDVIADADKIQNVLMNLIGNALKFTPEGGSITLSFELQNEHVITHITDTGVGIEEENMDDLFKKFGLMEDSYQTNQDVSQGTGLGLYICKSTIDLHDGEIWAHSEGKGTGSTFSFSLLKFSAEAFRNLKKQHQKTERNANKN